MNVSPKERVRLLLCRAYMIAAIGFASQTASDAAGIDDAEILAISVRHCVMCHAARPAHQSFAEPPKNVVLESIDDIKRNASLVMSQTIENRAMPPGNQTAMTDAERETLAQWIRVQR